MGEPWSDARLGDVGVWLSGGTPSMSNPAFWGREIPWVSPKDMKVLRIHDAIDHVTCLAIGNGTRLVEPGSILMVVRGMILAHSFPVAITDAPVAFNQDIKALVPGPRFEGAFLLYWLHSQTRNVLQLVDTSSHGTKRLPTETFFDLRVPLPPIAEQRKIAAILSSVDEAIEKTQAVIDQVQVVKKGLMQELLTKGLPGRHKTFKQTEIGLTPEDWSVVGFGELIGEGPTNGLYKPKSEYGDGLPIVRIDAFQNGECVDLQRAPRVRISDEEATRFALRGGDILINRVNSLSHIGKTGLVLETDGRAVFESNIMRIRVDGARVSSSYAFLFLSNPKTREHWLQRAKHAVAQASINQEDVRTLIVPLPSRDEQDEIVSMVATVEVRLQAERRNVQALATLKSALQSLLLTGELRVRPDPHPPTPEPS